MTQRNVPTCSETNVTTSTSDRIVVARLKRKCEIIQGCERTTSLPETPLSGFGMVTERAFLFQPNETKQAALAGRSYVCEMACSRYSLVKCLVQTATKYHKSLNSVGQQVRAHMIPLTIQHQNKRSSQLLRTYSGWRCDA